ncbi:unnamed protein product [Discosporangium mesarthrocarpum]
MPEMRHGVRGQSTPAASRPDTGFKASIGALGGVGDAKGTRMNQANRSCPARDGRDKMPRGTRGSVGSDLGSVGRVGLDVGRRLLTPPGSFRSPLGSPEGSRAGDGYLSDWPPTNDPASAQQWSREKDGGEDTFPAGEKERGAGSGDQEGQRRSAKELGSAVIGGGASRSESRALHGRQVLNPVEKGGAYDRDKGSDVAVRIEQLRKAKEALRVQAMEG